MSQAIGPFCDIKQDVTSFNYTEGAAVSLMMEVSVSQFGILIFQ